LSKRHPERSEGSQTIDIVRFFATLRMTIIPLLAFYVYYGLETQETPDCIILTISIILISGGGIDPQALIGRYPVRVQLSGSQ